MGRSLAHPPEEKLWIVLEVLADRMTLKQAASRAGVSTTSISNWKAQFLRAGRAHLAAGSSPSDAGDLAALQAENERLTEQLRKAAVLVDVWRMSARRDGDGDGEPPSLSRTPDPPPFSRNR